MESKNKYLGFRVSYVDYMLTLEAAERLGVSVTDLILSLLLPAINDPENIIIEKKVIRNRESILNIDQNEIELKSSNENLTELDEKIKKYNLKLKTI